MNGHDHETTSAMATVQAYLLQLASDPEEELRRSQHPRDNTPLDYCIRGSGWQSPVARWLRRVTYYDRRVDNVRVVMGRVVFVDEKGKERKIDMPIRVLKFELEFQWGLHPWLEERR